MREVAQVTGYHGTDRSEVPRRGIVRNLARRMLFEVVNEPPGYDLMICPGPFRCPHPHQDYSRGFGRGDADARGERAGRSPPRALGRAERPLCRPGDCADIYTACVAQREFLLSTSAHSWSAAWLHSSRVGAIAGRGTCLLLPDLRRWDWSETLARMRIAFVPAVRFFALRLSTGAGATLGLCRPRRPANPVPPGVQERHRHNHEVGTIGLC